MLSKSLRGSLFALSAGLLWGCSGTLIQSLFSQYTLSSEWLTSVRMISAGSLLLLFALLINGPAALLRPFQSASTLLRIALFAIAGLMFCQYTYLKAIYYSNSATATALQYLGQALILLVSCLKLRRRPVRLEWIALALALGGVFLISTHGNLNNLALSPLGLFWGLSAAVALMLYTLLPGDLTARYGAFVIGGLGMVIGGLAMHLISGALLSQPLLDSHGILLIALVTFLGTATAFTLYLQGVSDIGGVRASLLACVEPVIAAITTTLWLKTELLWPDWIAIVMILWMTILLALPKRK